eukprot:4483416-Pleurochrysis_carterae.AAC.1
MTTDLHGGPTCVNFTGHQSRSSRDMRNVACPGIVGENAPAPDPRARPVTRVVLLLATIYLTSSRSLALSQWL